VRNFLLYYVHKINFENYIIKNILCLLLLISNSLSCVVGDHPIISCVSLLQLQNFGCINIISLGSYSVKIFPIVDRE